MSMAAISRGPTNQVVERDVGRQTLVMRRANSVTGQMLQKSRSRS